MKHLLILFVAVIIQDCYHHGANASPTSNELAEGNAESIADGETDGKTSPRNGFFVTSSSSFGPGGWKTMFSGPQTGGSVMTFSNGPFSASSSSKSESSSSGTKQIQHIITMPGDSDGVFAQTGSFVSEEDEDIMPSRGRAQTSANAGVRTRLLGLGGSGSRSGLLGLGLGLL